MGNKDYKEVDWPYCSVEEALVMEGGVGSIQPTDKFIWWFFKKNKIKLVFQNHPFGYFSEIIYFVLISCVKSKAIKLYSGGFELPVQME